MKTAAGEGRRSDVGCALMVSVPAENKDHYPQTIMAKLGYAQQGLVLGWVPGRNPMNLLEAEGESAFLDLVDESGGQQA